MELKNKKILIIVGGGISAYKSLDLIRLLIKNNVEVKTILTKSGKEFVTPLSITSLTKNKTFEDIFDNNSEAEIDHIALSRWADLIIVLPTTANFMTKLSLGKAEDLATTVILASNKEVLLVPAMNVRMWLHKATQKNFKTLMDYSYQFIGPEKGEMACGEFGEGKMSSPRQILAYLKNYFDKKDYIKHKKFKALVTSGPTREYLDPVRYISNESSGKQGYEVALALNRLGIKTTLITGPTTQNVNSKDLNIKKITTANEMMNEVIKTLPVDIAVCAAAVSDFKPKNKSKNKIKKNVNDSKVIQLEENSDILSYLSKNNKNRPRVVVGFSAETENVIKNSKIKIKEKYCDFIVANDVSKNQGFNSDYNKVSIIDKKGGVQSIPKNKKSFIANKVAKIILDKLLINDKNFN
ncbi:bifunctional phosphopantothenoylcysteine decarboxylase/phosphopantothenate--cysteine ligase CoaBC [Candidatus Pelagibacter bacterium]|nr:bifunctional phosphopantothenoylcysteine decarboxylase/phosphopantothenate--cysteine ligase CoaBC [Candidatus Pelagibacter bacterium]